MNLLDNNKKKRKEKNKTKNNNVQQDGHIPLNCTQSLLNLQSHKIEGHIPRLLPLLQLGANHHSNPL